MLVAAVVSIVALDQATKAWAVAALADEPLDIVGETVQLSLGRNPGAAFSSFQGLTPLLAIGAVLVALYLARAARQARDPWVVTGLVLVLGGALGNLVDRLARSPGFLHGEVIDFVKVGGFPVFNVADSAITVGAIVLVWRSFRS